MAFLKKKACKRTYKNACSDKTIEDQEVSTPILKSLFSSIKKAGVDAEGGVITLDDDSNSDEPTFTNSDNYTVVPSPVCAIGTSFDTDILHNSECPTETKKPTHINLYTRYNVNSFSNVPTYYLVWYNVIISTGYRNYQTVCCASVKVSVSTVVGSSGFMCHLQKNICCETLYTADIETIPNIEDSIYLDSIETKTSIEKSEESSLSAIFVDFYNVLLSVFEELYPSCIMFGLNNIIIKNMQVDTNKVFSIFLEKIADRYVFFYKPLNDSTERAATIGGTPLSDDIQKIVSWLTSSHTEKFRCALESGENLELILDLLE